ncbi:AAEL000560-PA [Aedes aegypti]|uniref:AAEL000560-PA n=1 Tax=Aedes aegypti TaxID=7159 RepID=Q17NZ3_AEDAE|nr:AAEL000560-PA [Aedes aegypti]
MMRVAGIILVSYTIFCYSYNYAVASLNHKESSTTLKLDPSNKAPVFHHSTCTCNTEAQFVVTNDTRGETPSIPLNICHCRTCIGQDSDDLANPNLLCVDNVMTEDEYRSLLAQTKPSEPPRHTNRKKRSPYTWEELLEKISFMGSHDSTYNKRTQGYFHYNYANSSAAPPIGAGQNGG